MYGDPRAIVVEGDIVNTANLGQYSFYLLSIAVLERIAVPEYGMRTFIAARQMRRHYEALGLVQGMAHGSSLHICSSLPYSNRQRSNTAVNFFEETVKLFEEQGGLVRFELQL